MHANAPQIPHGISTSSQTYQFYAIESFGAFFQRDETLANPTKVTHRSLRRNIALNATVCGNKAAKIDGIKRQIQLSIEIASVSSNAFVVFRTYARRKASAHRVILCVPALNRIQWQNIHLRIPRDMF